MVLSKIKQDVQKFAHLDRAAEALVIFIDELLRFEEFQEQHWMCALETTFYPHTDPPEKCFCINFLNMSVVFAQDSMSAGSLVEGEYISKDFSGLATEDIIKLAHWVALRVNKIDT